ncbi:MAG: hypothetical protein ACYSSI_03675 [Planctomycetota bacterium]|jgi:uncharacterized Zn finger protein
MEEKIKMYCLFCKSEQFELPDANYQPSHGEMIKCANCGRLNDYTSMLEVTKEKAMQIAKKEAEKMIKDFSKKFKI